MAPTTEASSSRVARRTPVAPLERLFPLMWLGFWINAASGIVLLMADATTKLINPVFYIKMAFIGVAVVMIYQLRKQVFRTGLDKLAVPTKGKVFAAISLVCWLGAITAGRLMAYIGPVSGEPGLKNRF